MKSLLPGIFVVGGLLFGTATPAAPAGTVRLEGKAPGTPREDVLVLESPWTRFERGVFFARGLKPAGIKLAIEKDGTFSANVDPGLWQLRWEPVSSVPLTLGLFPLSHSQVIEDLPPPAKPAWLNVRLLAPDGELPAASVLDGGVVLVEPAANWRPESAVRPGLRRARIERDGTCRLPVLPDEEVIIHVMVPGFLPLRSKTAAKSINFRIIASTGLAVRVVDESLRPLGGQWIESADGRPIGMTSENGEIRIPDGVSRLRIEGEIGEPWWVELDRSSPAPVRAQRQRALLLAGRVVAADTLEPISGAIVFRPDAPGEHAISGPDGNYKLPMPKVRGELVSAWAPGFSQEFSSDQSGQLDFKLAPADQDVFGIVEDMDGRPVAANVQVCSRSEHQCRKISVNRSGRFASRSLPRAPLTVRAEARGYLPSAIGLRAPTPETEIRVVLQSGGTLSGTVLLPSGDNAAGASIQVLDGEAVVAAGVVGAQGLWSLSQLPGGRQLTIFISLAGYADTRLRFRFPPGRAILQLEPVVLEKAFDWRGRLVDSAGNPVGGGAVWLWRSPNIDRHLAAAGPAFPAQAISDATGEIRLGGLRLDEVVSLEVRAPGFLPKLLADVVVGAGNELEIGLEGAASLTVETRDAEGDPLPFAEVVIETGGGIRNLRTDELGQLSIAEVEPGNANIRLLSDGVTQAALSVELERGKRALATLALEQKGSIGGRVLDHSGNPVHGAVVEAFEAAGNSALLGRAETNLAGLFRLDGLSRDEVELEIAHPQHGVIIVPVEPARQMGEYRFTSSEVLLRVRVLNEDGVSSAGARLRLICERRPFATRFTYLSEPETEGEIELKVPSGQYLLEIFVGDQAFHTDSIQLSDTVETREILLRPVDHARQ